ncbi:MAG: GNAT family N-acetyltransferase [Anaerolineales bacterium]|nr:MAG: GNAT family N-acetyltransferase [Anaerolineales bacterium]
MGVTIRAGGVEDLPGAAALWKQLDAYHRSLGLAFPEVENAPQKWAESFQRTLGRFSFLWLAEQDGQALGFLMARVKQSPAYLGGQQVGEISDLYVKEAARGGGLAAQLAQTAMQKFTELGVHSVEVQVQAGNEAGLAFWRKQGFALDLTLVRKVL